MESRFYETILEYYDDIFPLNGQQVSFVERHVKNRSAQLLEVGCANGKLTHALSAYKITGIDIEKAFIDAAALRYPEMAFYCMNMLDIAQLNQSFEAIISFGNTLVHLQRAEIQNFLNIAYNVLKPNAKLLLQILNYDYILNEHITELPLIDNERIRFERRYVHVVPFLFNTRLTIKKSMQVIENSIPLTPIRRQELYLSLKMAGFKSINAYGDFKDTPLTGQSLPLIISAEK